MANRLPAIAVAGIVILFLIYSSFFVVNARHREFLPDEQAICSASAFVRMRGFVFAGMTDGEIRQMEPMVAASLMYGSAIRMICLRLDGIIDTPIEPLFDALWDGVWRSLKPD